MEAATKMKNAFYFASEALFVLKINIFLEKSSTKCDGENSPRPYSEK